ncbi:(deoxy)nucleoside triphosphate pyrophosphohydrolase [Desertibacillus haloalkaliphilus]|uniref:(deoxy)nucleoside triphosphate pyrophosphohydrolase n=1 Tax=Desertibacillus haloalkaliphilus TaxID=1328930 RepID=UPI001C27C0D6|nr:(deoxy)nucleoside triphosphate pyrophosphohydrolase [Desertibacillus haloalkaliphilus]MBU8905301.1 (deoxy)nucleoside triphosphate pyrophosphohydrolase [Desertibacillus haloalkaliphilus]
MKRTITVVAAVIKNENEQVFTALRSEKMAEANLWEFPGGKVKQGEQLEEALRREIHEELDCDIVVKDKITDTVYEYSDKIVHLHTFWATLTSGVPKATEHDEVRWCTFNQLKELRWAPADVETVEKITSSC